MIELEKLDVLILIRLSAPPRRATASSLRKPLERYVSADIPRGQFPAVFDKRVASLRERGLVEGDRFELTEAGRAHLKSIIGTDKLSMRAAPAVLSALALGLDPGDAKTRKRLKDAEGLAAAVLEDRHELGGASTLTAAVDQLAWKLLTGESGRLTLNKAREHLVSKALGAPARGDFKRAARKLAAKELGAGGTDAAKLGERLTRTWLTAVSTPVEPASPAPQRDTLREFARRVNDVARRVDEGRWGQSKVFISAIWRALAGDPAIDSIDLPEFKRRLCEANRAGLVALHRADLVGAMDQRELAESEARYLNATFHFVEAPG